MSWSDLRRRWWLALATLALRARFFTGKASFIEAEIQTASDRAWEVSDPPGRGPLRRVVTHFRLRTRSPRAGKQGWQLFRERSRFPLTALGCGFCGHWYVIEVLSAGAAQPASYEGDWFSFTHSDFQGGARLFCLHCEQDGRPRVKFLAAGA